MSYLDWAPVASYPDRVSAELLGGLLAGEGVSFYISSDEPVPGLGGNFAVLVPPDLLHRAQWLLKQPPVSERELTYLALGDLPDSKEDGGC